MLEAGAYRRERRGSPPLRQDRKAVQQFRVAGHETMSASRRFWCPDESEARVRVPLSRRRRMELSPVLFMGLLVKQTDWNQGKLGE